MLLGTSILICFFGEFIRIEELFFELMNEKDATLSDMILSMKIKLNKYYGSIDQINKLLLITQILDLQCKLGFIQLTIYNLYL